MLVAGMATYLLLQLNINGIPMALNLQMMQLRFAEKRI